MMSQTFDFWESASVRLAAWIESHPVVCWAAFTAIYVATGIPRAIRRPLWFDELITFYVSRLPDLGSLWTALRQGADANPPLFHWINRICLALPMERALAIRLPAVAGFWVMSLCLYLVVRRRCGAPYAWLATLLPLATNAEYYSVEARPYAILLALSAFALLAWQRATEEGASWWPAVGLSVAIAAAISCHFYAVFLIPALGLGEMYRTIVRGRIDRRVCPAILLGAAPLAILFPMFDASGGYAGSAHSRPSVIRTLVSYPHLLEPLLVPAVAALLLAVAVAVAGRKLTHGDGQREVAFPDREAMAAAGLTLWPVLAGVFSLFFTGVYVWRYSLPAVVGVALLAAFFQWKAEGRRAVVATTMVLILFTYTSAVRTMSLGNIAPQPAMDLRAADRPLPVLVDCATAFLELQYYAAAADRARMWYAADPAEAARRLEVSAGDPGLVNLRPWAPIQAEKARTLLEGYRDFYLLEIIEKPGWLLPKLLEDGAVVRAVRQLGSSRLYLVERN